MNGWTKTRPSPRTNYWISILGPTFWAMHHYCWALIGLHRAQMAGVPPVIRKGMLQSGVGDYTFVITNAAPGFVLLPEVYTRMGEAQLIKGDVGDAYNSFARARAIKPDYWPAYLRWAEFQLKWNRKAEAKKTLEEGLQYAPEAKPLLDLYRSLGGNPADVRPLAKAHEADDGDLSAPSPSAAGSSP
jgi:tetratricopeptide (TPR) repeat protein